MTLSRSKTIVPHYASVADGKAKDGYYERALLYTPSSDQGRTWSEQQLIGPVEGIPGVRSRCEYGSEILEPRLLVIRGVAQHFLRPGANLRRGRGEPWIQCHHEAGALA